MPKTNIQTEAEHATLGEVTRRHFLANTTNGIGGLALAALAGGKAGAAINPPLGSNPLAAKQPQFPARAKRVIFLHMAGAISQLETFDYKPELHKLDGQACPKTYLEGKRFAFIQGTPNMLGPQAKFSQHGDSGAWVSDRLPHFAKTVDDVCFLKGMVTEEFNHAPAQMLLHSGFPRFGRPSMGTWVTYGLGTANENLPGFVVLVSGGTPSAGKGVWGSGFIPTVYSGVECRGKGEPVLYSQNPAGIARDVRRRSIDAINQLNEHQHRTWGDPETLTRIAQYELAFRMQTAVPEVMNINDEPQHVIDMYGAQPGAASFANNCLLARRLAENGVRFIQLFDRGWDSHGTGKNTDLNIGFRNKCQEIDRPIWALLTDLKQRGMLDDTLVVFGSEFGRTPMRENRGGRKMPNVGRDHHRDAFTMWMAGGGVRGGYSHGETDPIGYNVTSGRTEVFDLQATILHLLGLDHLRTTYHFQGRDYRLTDIHGHLIKEVIA